MSWDELNIWASLLGDLSFCALEQHPKAEPPVSEEKKSFAPGSLESPHSRSPEESAPRCPATAMALLIQEVRWDWIRRAIAVGMAP
jgi:hypothetical protein